VRLFTRRGYDWTDRYPAIARAAAKLRAKSFTIDGEAAVCGPDGIAIFDALHRRGIVTEAMLYAFDLLKLDGVDYRPLPLGKRKERLAHLVDRRLTGIVMNDHTDAPRRAGVQAGVRNGPGGHCVQAADRAIPLRSIPGLAQGQEPGQPGDAAGARRGMAATYAPERSDAVFLILTKVRPTSDIRDLSSHTPAKGTTDGKQQLAAVAHPARKTIKATVRCECGATKVSCTKRQLRNIRATCSSCGKKIIVRWSGVRAS
jgi:ATP dependent DNA ligase domain